jgi:hypothetical protein
MPLPPYSRTETLRISRYDDEAGGGWDFKIGDTDTLRIPMKTAQDIAAKILTETPQGEEDGNFEF